VTLLKRRRSGSLVIGACLLAHQVCNQVRDATSDLVADLAHPLGSGVGIDVPLCAKRVGATGLATG
jgi:hypothetical protein